MGSKSNPRARVEDRISGLPDAVLCHMLSFLPTKYAVRTSILSKRWEKTWASVPNLDFKYQSKSFQGFPPYRREKNDKCDTLDFSTFVDRVLSFRDSLDIKKFRLHCSCCSGDFSRIDGWIRTAIKQNVVELNLRVETSFGDPLIFELPQCIFMCRTLVVLKVYSNCITYAPPSTGCFLNLKILHVIIYYPDNDSVEKIFSCCPVLEDLTINAILGADDVLSFKVFAPELKTLRLILPHDCLFQDLEYQYSFFINCPKLENLDLRQEILSNYLFENAKSLVKASLDLFFHDMANLQSDYSNRATALLAGISNVKDLSLSAHMLKACCVPAFDNLKKLKLVLHDCYNWDLLTEMLKRSPNLEYLVVEHGEEEEDKDCVDDYEEHEEYLKHVLYSEHRWHTPEYVPSCLISHLKTITIRGFKGYPHEKKMVKYLLENGKVLNKMTIYNELSKELSTIQMGSRTCRLEFI